jgi:hypothetical protein
MTKITGVYIVLILSLFLLIWNVYQLDFDNLKNGPYSGIVSNVFLMLAMIISIRDLNKSNGKT